MSCVKEVHFETEGKMQRIFLLQETGKELLKKKTHMADIIKIQSKSLMTRKQLIFGLQWSGSDFRVHGFYGLKIVGVGYGVAGLIWDRRFESFTSNECVSPFTSTCPTGLASLVFGALISATDPVSVLTRARAEMQWSAG